MTAEEEVAWKAKQKAYKQTPEHKANQKAYRQTPERKASEKARERTPEYKANHKAYLNTPKYKESDNYTASLLGLPVSLLRQHPDLLEAKREQLKITRQLKQQNAQESK